MNDGPRKDPTTSEIVAKYGQADWLQFIEPNLGWPRLPPVEDEYGEVPTGSVELSESSALTPPSCYLRIRKYPEDPNDLDSLIKNSVHLRWWQARRLGIQLLAMANYLQPDEAVDHPRQETHNDRE